MVSVCGKVGNKLDQGLDTILDWAFKRCIFSARKKMISLFWVEISARLEDGDMQENLLVQLGVFTTFMMMTVNSAKGVISFEE